MAENIFAFIRDFVVIGYMFVLRIGVPVIITLFLGWWLERKLGEWDAKDIAAAQEAAAPEAAKEKERRDAELGIRS